MISYLKSSQVKLFTLLIIITALSIYSPSIKIPFINDEISFIQRTEISSIQESPSLFEKKDYDGFYYRPLPNFINGVTTLVFKYNYVFYRIFNISLHALAGVLLFYFILNLPFYNSRKNIIALFSALFFVTFPLGDYSVIWHTDLFDRILLIFYVGGLILFLRNNLKPSFSSIALFLLALLSKEMAFSFPLIIGLIYLCFNKDEKNIKGCLLTVLPYLIIAILFVIFRIYIFSNNVFTAKDTHSSSTIIDILKNYILFSGLLVFPFSIREVQVFILSHYVFTIITGFSFLLLAAIFIKYKVKKDIVLLFFTLFIVLTIAPASRLFMRWYLYLPSIGFTAFLAYIIFTMKVRKNSLSMALAVTILLIYSSALILKENKWVKVSNESVATLTNFLNTHRTEILERKKITFLTIPAKVDDIPVFQLGFVNMFNYYLNGDYPVDVEILSKSFIFNLSDKIPINFYKDRISMQQLGDNYFILFNNEENVKFDNNLYNNGNIHAFRINNGELKNKILYTFSNGQFYKLQDIE
jgi:hypothetical protein